MDIKPKIAVIDDEDFYLELWREALEEDADVSTFECFDNFLENNTHNLNRYDYIIVDILFATNRGNVNMLTINFSKTLRKNGYKGKLILNSNLKPSDIELEESHHYDLYLNKNADYILSDINKKLENESINWKKRIEI